MPFLVAVEQQTMVSCSLWTLRFHSLSLLLTHVRLEHADQPNFQIQCYLQGCQRTFKKFTAYRNHIYQYQDTLSPFLLMTNLTLIVKMTISPPLMQLIPCLTKIFIMNLCPLPNIKAHVCQLISFKMQLHVGYWRQVNATNFPSRSWMTSYLMSEASLIQVD